MEKITATVTDIKKPDADKYEYRVIKLRNRLDVLLIHNPECDKAACAMSVGVGSLFDPKDVEGLAHFLEHMLFMGTAKYPDEADYSKFISQHAGSCNAYTSDLNTVYYFSIDPAHFDGALDRFAQFFISPLFTQSATDRELLAVDSEFKKNLQIDSWRLMQLTRSHCNPNHPINRFTIGSLESLRDAPAAKGIDLRAMLLSFHKRFYSSNLSKLCILGKETLDELQDKVSEYFGDMVDKGVELGLSEYIGLGEQPFRKNIELCCEVLAVPVRDAHTLEFQFMLREQTRMWKTKPTSYASHAIGHEGKGSILSLLKAEELATELSSGGLWDHAGLCIFGIQLLLTEKGASDEGILRCGEIVFAGIRMINANPPEKWVFDEMKILREIEFRYKNVSDPASHVIAQASNLHHYPYEEVLAGPALLYEFDPEGVKDVLDRLTCENMRLLVCSKAYEAVYTDVEPIFGTKYSKRELRDVWKCRWNECLSGKVEIVGKDPNETKLSFMKKNIFVPENLNLRIIEGEVPKHPVLVKIPEDSSAYEKCSLYFKQDNTFKLPKATVFVRFTTSFAGSLRGHVMCDLYTLLVQELINEYAYDAEVAGLGVSISTSLSSGHGGIIDGIDVELSGFSHKLPLLLRALSETMAKPDIRDGIFNIAHSKMTRSLTIASKNKQAYEQAFQKRATYLQNPYYPVWERLDVLSEITVADLVRELGGVGKSTAIFDSAYMEALIMGNVTLKQALQMVDETARILGMKKPNMDLFHIHPAVTDLSASTVESNNGTVFLHRLTGSCTNKEDDNSASLLHIDVGAVSPSEGAMLTITCDWLHQPYFEELRTTQQLGYIVEAFSSRVLGKASICFLVQTASHEADYATDRTVEFIEYMLNNVECKNRIGVFSDGTEYKGCHISDPVGSSGENSLHPDKREVQAEEEKEESNKHNPHTMNEELFRTLKRGVIAQLEEQPKRLGEEAARYVSEIVIRRYQFNRREAQLEALNKMTYEDYTQFLAKIFNQKTPIFLIELQTLKKTEDQNSDQKNDADKQNRQTKKFIRDLNWQDTTNLTHSDFKLKLGRTHHLPPIATP